ncbi:helix-turn-helix domain-containing protein [Paenibacillus sp. LMG 31460]|uniref:Helix-turn-helix domain-containing protein n=2 Tax=Paenibacillus germinis TaxID=2654979 RepID=A0ABX1ZAD4_9BACL|nr:helix-turn-helix domain-containing protein [Paenibacillus germinis]
MELADFLRTRRLRLLPKEAGLSVDHSRRRTSGLRREEVAVLAGISLPWYTALEQGRDIRVSDQVLDSLARTLRLNPDERRHLFTLSLQMLRMEVQNTWKNEISQVHQEILDQFQFCPAYIADMRWNILAWNRMAVQVFGDFERMSLQERNLIWYMFTNEACRELYTKWEMLAQSLLAQLRSDYGKLVDDPWYVEMIGELSEVSPAFRELWARHDVTENPEERKEMRHPAVGTLILEHKSFVLKENKNLMMKMFTPADSETRRKLEQLTLF